MYIGIDVGGSHIGIGLLDDAYNILENKDIYTNDYEHDKVIDQLILVLSETINSSVKGIGIGLPGICDVNNKKVLSTSNIKYNVNDLIHRVKETFEIPVFIDNDVNCACIAEYFKGNLKYVNNGMFIAIGTGIGGAIICNGNIYRGKNYTAGEIGHMTMSLNGLDCGCGRKGCFEKYASLSALVRMYNENDFKYTKKQIIQLILNEDKETEHIIDEWLSNLAQGLISIYNIIDCDKIVIGGGVSKIYDKIITRLNDKIKEGIYNKEKDIIIEKSIFNNDAGIIGSAMLCELT